jgi:hypothetical protein
VFETLAGMLRAAQMILLPMLLGNTIRMRRVMQFGISLLFPGTCVILVFRGHMIRSPNHSDRHEVDRSL